MSPHRQYNELVDKVMSSETKVSEMETTVEDLQWDIEKLRKREQKLNKHLAEALDQVCVCVCVCVRVCACVCERKMYVLVVHQCVYICCLRDVRGLLCCPAVPCIWLVATSSTKYACCKLLFTFRHQNVNKSVHHPSKPFKGRDGSHSLALCFIYALPLSIIGLWCALLCFVVHSWTLDTTARAVQEVCPGVRSLSTFRRWPRIHYRIPRTQFFSVNQHIYEWCVQPKALD